MPVLQSVALALATALLLAGINERVVAALIAPVKKKWPDLDLWWLLYPSWVLGGVLTYLGGVNLFAELVPEFTPTVGQVLSAIVVGGGANLIHDIFDKPPTNTLTATSDMPGVMSASVRTDAPPPAVSYTPKDSGPAGNSQLG